jgi:hypothetical protein
VTLPIAVLLGGTWLHLWPTLLSVNRVAVCETGLYPAFKPKKRLSRDDWFLPYRDVVSMAPVQPKKGLVPAYNVTARDGSRFQLNALDLLVYVDQSVVQWYMRLLAIVREEVERPQNRALAGRGEDIVIPTERFARAGEPPIVKVGLLGGDLWYWIIAGLVIAFVIAVLVWPR